MKSYFDCKKMIINFLKSICYNHFCVNFSMVKNFLFSMVFFDQLKKPTFTVILAVMLKSAILMPKNSMCPILPLNKNYLRNYLEPKNYLEVPEWQDDSWSGNCSINSSSGQLLKSKTPVEILQIHSAHFLVLLLQIYVYQVEMIPFCS